MKMKSTGVRDEAPSIPIFKHAGSAKTGAASKNNNFAMALGGQRSCQRAVGTTSSTRNDVPRHRSPPPAATGRSPRTRTG